MTTIAERLESALPVIAAGADSADADAKFPSSSIEALASSGLLGLTLPPTVGGLGASPSQLVDTLATVAGACGSTSMIYLMHLSAAMVLAAAPPADGEAVLADLARGDKLATLAFSEKGSRSHFWAPVSRAVRTGGGVHIDAHKSWVTSASEADLYVVSTLAPDASGPTESDLYLVDRVGTGISVAARFDGLGMRANDSAPVDISIDVAESARVGDSAAGFGLMMEVVLPWFSLGNAAVTLGLARSAIERAIGHVSGARLEHLDSSLADLPTIRAYVAKAWADLVAHEAMLRETARSVEQPSDGTVLAVLATKAACNEAALRVTETALRVTGGAGFSKHVGIDRPYRDARAGFVMAPTSDALFDFAGRALCGMDLF
jgi:alkylation response protein AidB-like acyl-CoA dehydrogenase